MMLVLDGVLVILCKVGSIVIINIVEQSFCFIFGIVLIGVVYLLCFFEVFMWIGVFIVVILVFIFLILCCWYYVYVVWWVDWLCFGMV